MGISFDRMLTGDPLQQKRAFNETLLGDKERKMVMINRIKLATMLFVAVLALTCVSQVRAQVEKRLTFRVLGILPFNGTAGGQAVVTLKQKGKKITGEVEGYKIKGTLKGSKISMKILGGCFPIYAGTASNTKMTNGEMNCTPRRWSRYMERRKGG